MQKCVFSRGFQQIYADIHTKQVQTFWILAKIWNHITKLVSDAAEEGRLKGPQKNDHFNECVGNLESEEPRESEDEVVKRADGHLGRDGQIEARAFPQQYHEVPDESSYLLQLSPKELGKHKIAVSWPINLRLVQHGATLKAPFQVVSKKNITNSTANRSLLDEIFLIV